jgi:hypothetical protein
MSGGEWGVRYPNGDVERAGILGENRARMLAARFGGQAVVLEPESAAPGCDDCGAGRGQECAPYCYGSLGEGES